MTRFIASMRRGKAKDTGISTSASTAAISWTELERQLGPLEDRHPLASSANSELWAVRSPAHPGRELALKVGRQDASVDELARFRHEARLLAEVRHPHVIEVLEAGVVAPSTPYLLMERVSSSPVSTLFEAGFDVERWRRIALSLAAGLGHIHRHGLIHLDLKPANLGLGLPHRAEDPRVVILDLGLATERSANDGQIRGTLAYVAPEVLLQDRFDHRADFYSLGLTLFELATGRLPFEGGDTQAVLFHLHGALPDPRRFVPDLPEDLAAVLMRLTRREPERRYADAGRLLEDLGRGSDLAAPDLAGRWMGSGTVLASRLIGRDTVLGELHRALETAAQGQGRTVFLTGPAGVGKASLLRELRRTAATEGARVAWSPPRDGLGGSLDAVAETLARAGVDWPSPELGPETGDRAVETARLRVYDELAARLVARAGDGSNGPLLLLFQDLDAAGPEALELVGDLARAVGRSPVLMVASCRSRPDVDPASATFLPVEPLAPHEVRELVQASLGFDGADSLPGELYGWLETAAQGYPARVQRALRELLDGEALRYRDHRWALDAEGLARLSQHHADLERGRIERLDRSTRSVLEALAVASGAHRLERIAGWLEVEPTELFADLGRLVAAGLADRWLADGASVWSVADTRLAEVVLADLQPERLRDLDRRLFREYAARFERGDAAAAVPAAEHGWRAGDAGESLPFLFAVGERATARFAHAEAARAFGRAVVAASQVGPPETARRARIAHARALATAGDAEGALARYEEVLGASAPAPRLRLEVGRLRGRLGDPAASRVELERGLAELRALPEDLELEIELRQGLAVALRDAGQLEASFSAAREALRRLASGGFAHQRALLWNTFARLAGSRGEHRRAERLARWGLRVAQASGANQAVTVLTNTLATERWRRGDLTGAAALFDQLLSACRAIHDVWGEQAALNNLGILAASQGHWQQARDLLIPSLDLARRLRQRPAEALTSVNLAEIEEILGHFEPAERLVERATKLLASAPAADGERIAVHLRGASLKRKRGQAEAAEHLARQALTGALENADVDLRASARGELAFALAARELRAAADEEITRALAEAQGGATPECLGHLLLIAAELALERSDPAAARLRLVEARRVLEPLGDRRTEGRLLTLEGLAAVNPTAAEDAFERANRLLEAAGASYDSARAQLAQGLATAAPARARERLAAADERLEALDAPIDAARARGAWLRLATAARPAADPTLPEVFRLINSSLDLQEVLDRTMDLALERLRAEHGMIVLQDPITRELEVATARNLDAAAPGTADEGRRLSESVVRRVLDRNEPILSVDAVVDSRFAGAESIAASHILSILCVPLAIRSRLVGAIYVDHRQSRHVFTPHDLEFLVAFADGAAIAIDNARLYGEIDRSRQHLKAENELLRREMLASHRLSALVGRSRAVEELKSTLERIAGSTSTVLVRGESGTGKGLVARTLHGISSRREGPFVAFNCAALPESLIESELFGHEKGAFTGAIQRKLGRFELAHGGTIFLDEIGKVSLGVQAKLLRVVEDKEFERVGGTHTVKVDVRIVTATNLDLEEAIRRDDFREDLYYRLNIIPIVLPPLRERREDIPYLLQHFLGRIQRDLGQAPKEIEPAVLELFLRYRWPGNIRELESAVHRALVLSTGDRLRVDDFAWIQMATGDRPRPVATERPLPFPTRSLDGGLGYQEALDRLDRQMVEAALEQCGGRIRETARALGVARNTLKAKIKRFGLTTPEDN